MHRRFRARIIAALGASALLVASGVFPARGQVAVSQANFGGYATGTVIHADALEGEGTRLADVEVAQTGAAYGDDLAASVQNEMDRVIQPERSGKVSYAGSTGLEVGLGLTPPSAENQIILPEKIEADSPPPSANRAELVNVPAEPLAYVDVLTAEAEARGAPHVCALGSDGSFARTQVADAQLLDTDGESDDDPKLDAPLVATDATDPDRAVSTSISRTRLVPQVNQDGDVEGDAVGLMTEVRMTIAPVTIGGQVTLEFLGEWVLRAVATGKSGWVHYGPGAVEPSTPVLRIIQEGEVTDVLTLQDLLGEEGLVIPIPELGVEIAIGEDARAIGGDAESDPTETATLAAGAVDVARVRLLDLPDPGVSLTDLRIGHMEARAEVPPDGLRCEIPVDKTADPETVTVDDEFTHTITVNNPFDCTLTGVRVIDMTSASEGVTFELLEASDGGVIDGSQITWADVGPIEPGGSKVVTVKGRVTGATGPGNITDEVTVTGRCELDTPDGSATADVATEGRARLDLPEIDTVAGQVTGQGDAPAAAADGPAVAADEPLPATGGSVPLASGAALTLLAGAAALRRFRV